MIIAARTGDSVPYLLAKQMIFMSTLPLEGCYGRHKVMEIFAECVASYDLNIGCSYSLFENNRPMAYAFVFDAFKTNDSAPHLHTLSVYPSKYKQGYGSKLLLEILDRVKHTGLTLECSHDSAEFFEKYGFEARDDVINGNHLAMFTHHAKHRPIFKMPKLTQDDYDHYFEIYCKTRDSLVAKKMITLDRP